MFFALVPRTCALITVPFARGEKGPANIIIKIHRPGRQTRRGHYHHTLLRLVIKRLSSVYVFRSGSPNMCIDYRAIRSWRKVPRTSSSKFTALAVKLAADIIIRRYYGWLSSAYQASIKRLCFSVWFPEHVH